MTSFLSSTFQISELSFERNEMLLLNRLTKNIFSGELLEIRGNNGSGKSTLLRILAGFIQPSNGNIFFNQESIFSNKEHYKKYIHYLGHQHGLKKQLTVLENIFLFFKIN